MNRILTTSNICVDTIESVDDDLEIVSNNKILFNTPYLLIGNMLFNNFCSNIVFQKNEALSDEHAFKSSTTDISEKDNISRMSEYTLVAIDCAQITSEETYQVVDGINKQNYINLLGKRKVYLKSANIFINNESFHDFVYREINNKTIVNSDVFDTKIETPQAVIDPVNREADLTRMGTFVTNKVFCNTVSTENVYISGSTGPEEPILKILSGSAINLGVLNGTDFENNIFIEDDGVNVKMDTYLKRRLDENNMFDININAEPGVDITIYYDQGSIGEGFSNHYQHISAFDYNVNFKIVLTNMIPNIPQEIGIYDMYYSPQIGSGINIEDDQLTTGIRMGLTNNTRYPLSNLTAGQFYDVYADVTNNFTGTTIYNVKTNAINVPTIEHVVINSITVINEREIEIQFAPHVTRVPTWSTPETLVYFSVKLYNHDDSSHLTNTFTYVAPTTYAKPVQNQNAQLTYNISLNEDRNTRLQNRMLTYRFDVNFFENYSNLITEFQNHSYSVIKLDGSNSEDNRSTSGHTFSIVSRHVSGTFEMVSIPNTPTHVMINHTFENPSRPTNFTVQYPEGTSHPPNRSNIFEWTVSTNSDTRITKLFYEIFRNEFPNDRLNSDDMEDVNVLKNDDVKSSTDILQNIGSIDSGDVRNQVEGIIPDTYKIRAYNLFGQRSVYTEYQVKLLNITNLRMSPNGNKSWKVYFDIIDRNGECVVTTNVNPSNSISNNDEEFLTYFNTFGTHSLWVQLQDTVMKIKSNDISVLITQPTITFFNGAYTGSLNRNREYTFTIQINQKSLDFTNESLKINNLSDVSNLNDGTKPISTYTIIALNQTEAKMRFIVGDKHALDETSSLQYTINISFSLVATDIYGYKTQLTPIPAANNTITVRFDGMDINSQHAGNRRFNLSTTENCIGFKWQLNNVNVNDGTNTSATLVFNDAEDDEQKFGYFRCRINQQNLQGFTKIIYSRDLYNPAPTINSGHVFSIIKTNEYTFFYQGNNTTSLQGNFTQVSVNQECEIRFSTTQNGSYDNTLHTTFTQNGYYKLQVFVRNIYYFGKWLQIGTPFRVTRPTTPTFGIEKISYHTVRLNVNWGVMPTSNGTPTESIVAYEYQYYPTQSSAVPNIVFQGSPSPPSSVDIILNNGTRYNFRIFKRYSNYGVIQSSQLNIQTPEKAIFLTPTKDFHSVTVNYNLTTNGDYTGHAELIYRYNNQTITRNISGSSEKIVTGIGNSITDVIIRKRFTNGTAYLDTSYSGTITVNTIYYPNIPSITHTSVSTLNITVYYSVGNLNSYSDGPTSILLYWSGGGVINLNGSGTYTFAAQSYNTEYTFYKIETLYNGTYTDGKPHVTKVSNGSKTATTPPRPPNPPIITTTNIHSVYIYLYWDSGLNYNATSVTYSVQVNGTTIVSNLSSLSYLLTWESNKGNLRSGTTYTIRVTKTVVAPQSLANLSFYDEETITTSPASNPQITSYNSTHNSISLNWNSGSNPTDNVATSNVKYLLYLSKYSGSSEGGVTIIHQGYIKNYNYANNLSEIITNYTLNGTNYAIVSNTQYFIQVKKEITYYGRVYADWRDDFIITTSQYVEPYWPQITSHSIDGKNITISYSTGSPGSRTRSGVSLAISKNGGGYSKTIQFSVHSTTGSHTETLPEYDTGYVFQMAVAYDNNTYTKNQSGYHTYITEEEPLDSSGWTLINDNGLGIDYGRWDSLINNNGSSVAKIGINTFPFSSYTFNQVKDIANTYSDAFYIVDNRRSEHLNYYIHDGSRNVTSYNNPDGAIYVWTKNTSTEPVEVLSAGWAEYTNTDYGQGIHGVVSYRNSTRTINDIISEANQNSEITHIVRNRVHWFLCRTGGFIEGPKSWCTLWIKNETGTVSWAVYNDYNINGGGFWDSAPITTGNETSGGAWVRYMDYTLDEVKAFIGNSDVFIVQVGNGSNGIHDRYYFRVSDGKNKLLPKSEPALVYSYVKNTSAIEYHNTISYT